MSVFNTSQAATNQVSILAATTPVVFNFSIVLANTEYSYALPINTKQFRLQVRDLATLKLAYAPGDSGTNYITIHPLSYYKEVDLSLNGLVSIYFQSTKPGQVLEIISWS